MTRPGRTILFWVNGLNLQHPTVWSDCKMFFLGFFFFVSPRIDNYWGQDVGGFTVYEQTATNLLIVVNDGGIWLEVKNEMFQDKTFDKSSTAAWGVVCDDRKSFTCFMELPQNMWTDNKQVKTIQHCCKLSSVATSATKNKARWRALTAFYEHEPLYMPF